MAWKWKGLSNLSITGINQALLGTRTNKLPPDKAGNFYFKFVENQSLMENSIRETNIDRIRTRPRFTIETSIAPKDYEQILKEHLRTEFSGQAPQCGLSLCFCISHLPCFGWCSSRFGS